MFGNAGYLILCLMSGSHWYRSFADCQYIFGTRLEPVIIIQVVIEISPLVQDIAMFSLISPFLFMTLETCRSTSGLDSPQILEMASFPTKSILRPIWLNNKVALKPAFSWSYNKATFTRYGLWPWSGRFNAAVSLHGCV